MSSGWTVTAVRYATLETTRSDAYYRYQAYGEPDGPQRLDYFFWIVRRPDETILVDTGFDPDVGRRRGRTCLIEPAVAMAQLGVSPDTVSRVVLTHLHYDHTGNLDLFPDAQLLVPARELDFWLGPLARRAQFAHAVEASELGQVLAAVDAGRVRRLEGARRSPKACARSSSAATRRGRSRSASTRRRAGSCSPQTPCTSTRSSSATGRSASSPTWPRCTRATTRCASWPAPGAHLVPGHDAEVMTRYPRVEGPAADFAVEIR